MNFLRWFGLVVVCVSLWLMIRPFPAATSVVSAEKSWLPPVAQTEFFAPERNGLPRLPFRQAQQPLFTLSANVTSATVDAGQSAIFLISAVSETTGKGTVALRTQGLPANIIGAFQPNPIVFNGSPAQLTVTTAAGLNGTFAFEVIGAAINNGTTVEQRLPLSLTVRTTAQPDFSLSLSQPSVTVTPGKEVTVSVLTKSSNGFTGPVTLGVTGVPAGMTATVTPPVTPAGGLATLKLTVSTVVSEGNFNLNVTGTAAVNGQSVTRTTPLSVLTRYDDIGNFTVTANPTITIVKPGASVTVTIQTAPTRGFNRTLFLSAPNLPTGITASFSATKLAPGESSQLQITAAAGLKAASPRLAIRCMSDPNNPVVITHEAPLDVVIDGPAANDYQFQVTPPEQTVRPGGQTSFRISFLPIGNFQSAVPLTVGTLPPGLQADLSAPTTNPDTPTTLTVMAAADAQPGVRTLSLTGFLGSTNPEQPPHTIQIKVVVGGTDTGTTLTGRILSAEATPQPLAGVTIYIHGRPGQRAISGSDGRFTLAGLTTKAREVFLIDGSTASTAQATYPKLPIGFDLIPNTINTLDEPIYLPKVDTAHLVAIQQDAPTEQVITNPAIPNMQVVIPAHTQVLNPDGTPVTQMSITAVRGDRLPVRHPQGMDLTTVPQAYLLYPNGAASTKYLKFTFPNAYQSPAGQPMVWWQEDREAGRFRVKGAGFVTANSLQIAVNQPTEDNAARLTDGSAADFQPNQGNLLPNLRFRDLWGWSFWSLPCGPYPPPPPNAPQITGFRVSPSVLTLSQGQSIQLTAQMELSDGTVQDATSFCSFEDNPDQINNVTPDNPLAATVSPLGIVTAGVFPPGWNCGLNPCLLQSLMRVRLTPPPGIACGENNQQVERTRFVLIEVTRKALLYAVESDYTPVVQSRGGAMILNGHPIHLKIRFLPADGSHIVELYAPNPSSSFTMPKPPMLLFSGAVGAQEVTIPIPDSLFSAERRYIVGVTALVREGAGGCIFVGDYALRKYPNLSFSFTPGQIPLIQPNPEDPAKGLTASDVLFELHSDLDLTKFPEWWAQDLGNLWLLKNGTLDSYLKSCFANGIACPYVLPAGTELDLTASYEVSLIGSNASLYLYEGNWSTWIAYDYWNNPGCWTYPGWVRWGGYYGVSGYAGNFTQIDCGGSSNPVGCFLQLASAPLPLQQALILAYHKQVAVRQEILDAATVCTSPSSFYFRLSTPCHIKITAGVLDQEKIVYEGDAPVGDNYAPVPTYLPLGETPFQIAATALSDPNKQDSRPGVISVGQTVNNTLPVGHTFVKGVDIADGHLTMAATDIKIPGRGLSLEYSRSYSNTSISLRSPLGAGWSDNYHSRLIRTFTGSCEHFLVVGGDGQGQKFKRTGTTGNTLAPMRGYHGTLVETPVTMEDPNGGYDFTTKEGVVYHYGPTIPMAAGAPEYPVDPGNLKYIREPNGNRLTMTYDPGTLRLAKVTDSSGRFLTFTYSSQLYGGAQRIVTVTGPMNLTVEYTYDTAGNLKTVTRKGNTDGGSQPANDRTWTYHYSTDSSFGLLTNRLDAVTDPRGNTTNYEFYTLADKFPGEGILPANCDLSTGNCTVLTAPTKLNCVKKITEPAGTDGQPIVTQFIYDYRDFATPGPYRGTHIAQVIDGRNLSTSYVLDDQGQAIEIRQPLTATTKIKWHTTDVYKDEEIDANGRKTTYIHDPKGNLTEERVFTTDLGQVVTSYGYEGKFNRLTSRTEAHADGAPGNQTRTTTYEIDHDNGNLRSMTDAMNHVTQFTYDQSNGNLLSKLDSRGFTTTYLYNGPGGQYGKPSAVVEQTGTGIITTTMEYDDRSRLVRERSPHGRVTEYTYDELDQVVRMTVHDDNGASAGSSQDSIVTFEYYPNGELLKRTDMTSGITLEYALDPLNRVIGTQVRDLNGNNFSTATDYDANSNPVRVTDRRGVTQVITYDDLNRPLKVTLEGLFGGPNNGTNILREMTYDLVGNKQTEKDFHGNTTTFDYDGLYRLKKKTLPEINPANGQPYTELFKFNEVGELERFTDANSHPMMTAYDRLGRKTSVTDALGRQMTWIYAGNDASANPAEMHDLAHGLDTFMQYDGLYRPKRREVQSSLGRPGSLGSLGSQNQSQSSVLSPQSFSYVTTWAYDDTTNRVTMTDPRNVVHQTQMDGFERVFKTVMDLGGLNLTSYSHYDDRGNRVRSTDPNGASDGDPLHTTNWVYDVLNRVEQVNYPLGVQERFVLDGEGNVTSRTNRNGYTTQTSYDNLGRVTSILVPKGISNVLDCNVQGEYTLSTTYLDQMAARSGTVSYQTTVRDGIGRVTATSYDRMGRMVKVEDGIGRAESRSRTMTWDGINKVSETDWSASGTGNLTQYQYDVVNRLKLVTDPYGKQVHTDYLDAQNQVVVTDKRGIVHTTQMDALGRTVSMQETGTDAASITNFVRQYDGNGNVTQTTDAVGNLTKFEYDGMNRLRFTRRGFGSPVESVIEQTFDRNGNLTGVINNHLNMTYTYDGLNRRRTSLDGENRLTQFDYDGEGNLTRMVDPYQNGVTYQYDELNALLKVTQPGGMVVDYRYDGMRRRVLDLRPDKAVQRIYDVLGRVKELIEFEPGCPYGSGERGGAGQGNTGTQVAHKTFNPKDATPITRTLYEYDANDNLKVLIDANNARIEYDYDNIHRLTTKRYPAATDGGWGATTRQFAYSYNDNNLPTQVDETRIDNSTAQYRMGYDGLDRVNSVTDSLGKNLSMTYYDTGLRKTLTDAVGGMTLYTYDELNRVKGVTSPYGGAEYEYFTDDLVQRVSLPNKTAPQTTCTYNYDNAGRVTDVWNQQRPSSNTISRYQLSYNDPANKITLAENQNGQMEVMNFTFGGPMNRLSRAEYGNYAVDYSYNAAGNRMTEIATGAVQYNKTYSYGPIGRLNQVTDSIANRTTSFTYDGNGNQKTKTVQTGTGTPVVTLYDYDIRDNLRKVSIDGQTKGTYQYDYDSRRIKQVTSTGTLWTTFDGAGVNAEWNDTVQNTAVYVWGGGGAMLYRSEPGPTRTNFSYLWNHLGSTANVVNTTSAAVVQGVKYDVWGVIRNPQTLQTSNNRHLFTEQRWDEESGLYAMGNGTRFYDPDLGQFLEKDPVYGDESEPRSLSPYAYSFNNPVWYMDPTGLAAQDPGDKFSSTLPDAQNPKTTIGWTALGNDGSYGVSIGPLDPEKKPSHKKKHHPSATRKKAAQLPIITAPQPPPSTFPSNANLPPHGVTLEPTPETTAPEPPRPVEATVTQPGTTWSQTVDEFVGVASGLYGTLDDYGIISKAQIQGGIKGLENAGRGALSTGAGYLTHPITTFQNIQAQNADATIDIFKGLWNFREVAGAVYEGGQTLGLEGWQELEGEIGGNLAFGEASEALLWGAVSPGSGTPQTIFNGRVPSTGTRFAPPGGPAGESSISFAKKPLTPDTALGTFDADFANLSVPQKIDAAFQEIESAFGAGYAEKIRELYGSAGRSFFKSTETLGTHGLTNQGKSVIGVNTNLGNAKILANTLLHEVRHLRQYRKILSRGGTRRTWNNLSETAKERYATAPNVWQGRRLGLSPEDLTIFEEYQQHWRK